MALRLEPCQRAVDRAAVPECSLRVPGIETNSELLQIILDVRQHSLQGKVEHAEESLCADQSARTLDQPVDVKLFISSGSIWWKVRQNCSRRPLKIVAHLGAHVLGQIAHIV